MWYARLILFVCLVLCLLSQRTFSKLASRSWHRFSSSHSASLTPLEPRCIQLLAAITASWLEAHTNSPLDIFIAFRPLVVTLIDEAWLRMKCTSISPFFFFLGRLFAIQGLEDGSLSQHALGQGWCAWNGPVYAKWHTCLLSSAAAERCFWCIRWHDSLWLGFLSYFFIDINTYGVSTFDVMYLESPATDQAPLCGLMFVIRHPLPVWPVACHWAATLGAILRWWLGSGAACSEVMDTESHFSLDAQFKQEATDPVSHLKIRGF